MRMRWQRVQKDYYKLDIGPRPTGQKGAVTAKLFTLRVYRAPDGKWSADAMVNEQLGLHFWKKLSAFESAQQAKCAALDQADIALDDLHWRLLDFRATLTWREEQRAVADAVAKCEQRPRRYESLLERQ